MKNFRNNKFGGGRDFNNDRGDRPMYKATCANCGRPCEVPFKPTGVRPVLCNDCFRESKGSEPSRYQERPRYEERSFDRAPKNPETFQYKQSFDALNKKLDKIIELLTPQVKGVVEQVVEETPEKKKKKTTKKKST